MGPTHGHYILHLCMGPSYFRRGLTPPDSNLFRSLDTDSITIQHLQEMAPGVSNGHMPMTSRDPERSET